jgi:hypothetical protein
MEKVVSKKSPSSSVWSRPQKGAEIRVVYSFLFIYLMRLLISRVLIEEANTVCSVDVICKYKIILELRDNHQIVHLS